MRQMNGFVDLVSLKKNSWNILGLESSKFKKLLQIQVTVVSREKYHHTELINIIIF